MFLISLSIRESSRKFHYLKKFGKPILNGEDLNVSVIRRIYFDILTFSYYCLHICACMETSTWTKSHALFMECSLYSHALRWALAFVFKNNERLLPPNDWNGTTSFPPFNKGIFRKLHICKFYSSPICETVKLKVGNVSELKELKAYNTRMSLRIAFALPLGCS